MSLRIENLHKSYEDGARTIPILRGLHLTAHPGDVVAIVGRSGSGKSTLLNLIAGIDTPDQGSIHLAEHSLHDLDETNRTSVRRRHIGFVFQTFNLLPSLTALENTALSPNLNGLPLADSLQRAQQLLEHVDLDHRAHAYPHQLSGGERQRVAVAAALAHDPLLILADEPTGNLDADTGRTVASLLQDLTHTRNKILLLVTHDLELARHADRTLHLRNGTLHP